MTTTRTAPAASPSTRAGGLLRPALRLDAVVTGVNGAGYLLGAPLLDGPLGLSAGLLRSGGPGFDVDRNHHGKNRERHKGDDPQHTTTKPSLPPGPGRTGWRRPSTAAAGTCGTPQATRSSSTGGRR